MYGSGSHIDSGTTIRVSGDIIDSRIETRSQMSGTLTNGTPSASLVVRSARLPDAGAGGNIALTAGQSVTISNGASVSASSTGPGNTGNILINAGQTFSRRIAHDQ